MDSNIKKLVEDFMEIEQIDEYQFREIYGFTFVFKKKSLLFNNQISSSEIKPIAIIYEEKGEYYLAPIDVVDEIEEVVKEFVRKQLQ